MVLKATQNLLETNSRKFSRKYQLKCPVCGAKFEDNGIVLECANKHETGLLSSEYNLSRMEIDPSAQGIYRYRKWLPIVRELSGVSRTITFQSDPLCHVSKLPNLWVAFSGFWPEKGVAMETATFKELEAYSVLSRMPQNQNGILVVASAGNTAAAFAWVCSKNKIPCLIVIPESGLQRMQFSESLDLCVKIISLVGFTDYFDAITLANRISQLEGFFPEGGVKNVGRRDGMGTTILNAVEAIGRLPDYYFQAIGSGAGAIAAYETSKRLIEDDRFGQKIPRLMLSQNLPFVPIYLSWKTQRRKLIPINRDDGKKQIRQIVAHVLSNRQPAYSVKGGVYDVLQESHGDMLVADNSEALYAMDLFEKLEGIDIDPAAGVAFATLLRAANCGQIDRTATVLLNITGGGWYKRAFEKKLIPAKPALQIDEQNVFTEETLEKVTSLF